MTNGGDAKARSGGGVAAETYRERPASAGIGPNLLRFVLDLGGRNQPFETAQQVLFRHPVELALDFEFAGDRRGQGRRRFGLRLVDLDVMLQRVDEILGKVLRGERRFSDLAQGDDRIFVAVAIHQ